jgi:hypothetical protein
LPQPAHPAKPHVTVSMSVLKRYRAAVPRHPRRRAQRIGLRPRLARRPRPGPRPGAGRYRSRPTSLRSAPRRLVPVAERRRPARRGRRPRRAQRHRAAERVRPLHRRPGPDHQPAHRARPAPRQLSTGPESKRFRGPPVPAQTLSAYLHRRGDRKWVPRWARCGSGRASLCSLALIAAGSCERAAGSGGAERPHGGAAGALDAAARERIIGCGGKGANRGVSGFGGLARAFLAGDRGDLLHDGTGAARGQPGLPRPAGAVPRPAT